MMPKPPKKFLIDSFTYEEYLGEDDWGKATFGDSVEINFCRIDRRAEYSISSSGKVLLYNAVIFCYGGLTEPMKDFANQSRIIYDGQEHIITKVIPNYEAYDKTIYSIEIEVV